MKNISIKGPQDAAKIFLRLMKEVKKTFRFADEREIVMMITTNKSNAPKVAGIVSVGDVDFCSMPKKVILATALTTLSSGIILCHTHPSNNVNPSAEDIKQTKSLHEACECCDLKLLDHIVMASDGTKCYSFAEEEEVEL